MTAIRSRPGPAELDAVERDLLATGVDSTFDPAELAGLPDPVIRYFTAAIAPGTPLVRAARIEMRGRIKIGRWLPFTATEVLDPRRGFAWRARVAGRLVVGSDRYLDRAGAMRWRLFGLLPLVSASGPDLTRSAAGRAAGEGMWLPTAMLPRYGVEWSASSDHAVAARLTVDDTAAEIRYTLGPDGHVESTVFDRWGDPDRSRTWAWHRCGGEITAYRTFGGLTVPAAGRVGWHYGTNRWPEGEFFRYEITRMTH
jgi:hypothetical protein